MNVVSRAAMVLVDPVAEWARIESEPDDPVYLMTRYVASLALVPAVSGFIGACIIGVVVPGESAVRASIFNGLFGAIFGYLESFAVVSLIALFIAVLAPLFGGFRNFSAALKLAAYAFTPVWLAGIVLLLPGLRFLLLTGLYGVCILIAGLALLLKMPMRKSLSFAVLIAIVACGLIYGAAHARQLLFGGLGGL